MIEEIKSIFEKGRSKLNRYEEVVNKISKNPELIMTDLYYEGTDDNLLTHIVYVEDSNKLIEFQQYVFSLLIPYLTDFISIDEISLLYDSSEYPANIIVKYKGSDIATINIYNKVFTKLSNEKADNIISEIDITNEQLREIELRNSELEMAKINPLSLGGANPLKLIDIALRRKKYINKINEDIISVGEEAFNIQTKLQSLEIQLQGAKDSYIEIEYITERIERKLKNKFNYNSID